MSSGGGHGGRRKKHHEEHEEHENHERWLVSYADLVTVLMALFICMFAISSVNTAKSEALAASLAASFGGTPVVPIPGGGEVGADTAAAEGPLDLGAPISLSPAAPELSRETRENAAERQAADSKRRAVEGEVRRLEDVRKKLLAALEKKGLADQVRFRYDERGLVVSIVTDEVLFAPDRAELSGVGVDVLDAIGPVLSAVPNDISVEGHTNLVPVEPKYYPSEWELSSARAVTVVRHLVEKDGVPARRMSAIGYADQRPLIPGTSATANRLNRRVEVVVLSTLPPDQRALLPRMAPDVNS